MADEKRLYVFYGRILPERAHVYFNLKQKKAEIAGVNVEFDVFCFGSQFNGTAKFDKDVTQPAQARLGKESRPIAHTGLRCCASFRADRSEAGQFNGELPRPQHNRTGAE